MAKDNAELLAKMDEKNGNGKQKSPMQQISDYMNLPAVQAEIRSALGLGADPVRLIRTAKTQIGKNPKLLECSIQSLMSSIIQAAEEGLDFSLGQAWLVPYSVKKKLPGQGEIWVTECQYQRGYQGLLKLVRNTGEVGDVQAHPIYEHDTFYVERGDNAQCKHVPNFFKPGALIGFYAYGVLLETGKPHVEVMTLEEIEDIGKRSKSSKKDREGNFEKFGGPWATDFNEMGRKTVLKRCCKYLPISVTARETIEAEDTSEFSDASTIELNLEPPKPSVLTAGTHPRIEEVTQGSLTQSDLDKLTEESGTKLKEKAYRGSGVHPQDVAEIVGRVNGGDQSDELFPAE